MGFLSQLFSGIDDVARGDMGMFDDASRFDFSGMEDRMDGNLINIMENDALRTVGLPIADFFSFGLASPAAKAKYNKLKYGQSGFSLGDLGKSVAANYIASDLIPGSGSSATLGDVAYNTAAGAGRGAVSAGIQGESMTDGAKAGGIQAGLTSGGNYLGSSPATSGTTASANTSQGWLQQYGGQEQTSSPAYWSGDTGNTQYTMMTGTEQSRVPGAVQKGSPYAASYSASPSSSVDESGSTLDGLGSFMKSLMPQTSERFGDQMSNLMGLYSGYRRYRDAKNARSQFGVNRGAYEAQLQAKLAAQDAARGRRSNVAGRTTQLQAALAELDSRALPGMNQLRETQFSGLDNMLRSGFGLGQSMGYWGRQPTQSFGAVAPGPRPLSGMFNNVAPVQMPSFNIPSVGNIPRGDEMDTRRFPGT